MVHTSESAFSAKMETVRKREQMAYFIDGSGLSGRRELGLRTIYKSEIITKY
jgi:hypothetical protein